MSNPDDKPQISGSITYPESGNIDRNVPQPRQPADLQGLLRFALQATQEENAESQAPAQMGPIDEERKTFLEDALKSMTVDVIEILQKNIKLLQTANTLSVDADPEEYMNAFEIILEHIDRIDTANDFHKIGGYMIFQPCFNSVHGCIRAGACDVLAELCQNNPYCQNAATQDGILKPVLDILDKDPCDEARIKAVYAVSCNVRENEKGLAQFISHNGVQSVLRGMQGNVDKLRTKCAFLLSTLCGNHVEVRSILVQSEAIPTLIGLISETRRPSHEHLLSLLVGLITDNSEAIAQCSNARYNFKSTLAQHLSDIKDKEECQEEVQYCEQLLRTIFKDDQPETDR